MFGPNGGCKTHLDTPGQPGVLRRSGMLTPFTRVSIGNPFWAHGKVWVRTSYEAATELKPTGQIASCCNFMSDPWDFEVEMMEYSA